MCWASYPLLGNPMYNIVGLMIHFIYTLYKHTYLFHSVSWYLCKKWFKPWWFGLLTLKLGGVIPNFCWFHSHKILWVKSLGAKRYREKAGGWLFPQSYGNSRFWPPRKPWKNHSENHRITMGARITNSRTRATPLSSMLLPDAQKLADDPTKYGVAGLETFLGDV